jgi:predicted RNA binding protein YcfA (HicA-like mRNA interferase family)
MPISGREVIKILEKFGFEVTRQRGSHVVLRKTSGKTKQVAVVPIHKELKRGTLRSIAKQSGVDVKELGL